MSEEILTSFMGTEEMARRIEALEATLVNTDAEFARRLMELETIVANIQLTIQSFIAAAINAINEAKQLQTKLKQQMDNLNG